MSPSARKRAGLTLIELALVIGIVGIIGAATPVLLWQGVQAMVWLPRGQMVNQVTMEILHAMVEGSLSEAAQPVPGLRFAARPAGSSAPAIWLAAPQCVGYLTTDGQRVLFRLDGEQIKRSLPTSDTCLIAMPCQPTAAEDVIPYYAADRVRVLAPSNGALFRYYNQADNPIIPPPCSGSSEIRRIEIAFTAQTGTGAMTKAEARVDVNSSVAIRFP